MKDKTGITIWIITCVVFGMLGAVAAVGLFGHTLYKVGPVKVRLSVSPGISGRTVVNVPPLGRMTADTHRAPVQLSASIEEMDINAVRQIVVMRPRASDIIARTGHEAERALISFTFRLALLSLLGGAAAASVVSTRKRALAALIGGAAGILIIGVTVGAAALSFDRDALMEPHYEGALRSAPWMVKLVRQGFFHLDNLDTELRAAASNLSEIEGQISALAPVENGSAVTKLLVVSDLHNNTTAMRIVSDLAQAFDVSMVLNAGDLTDLGTPFEKSMASVMGDIPRPHVFVGGNHDSPQTFSVLKKLRNTYLPDEGLVRVAGLTVLGQSDPSAKSADQFVTVSAELKRSERDLLARYRILRERPDIILVHSPRVAKAFLGKAPIVVNGDDHRMHVGQVDGSVWIDPGTTGASGLRYFKQGSPKDITAVVVYLSRLPEVHAIAADLITIQSPRGEFLIQRKRFNGHTEADSPKAGDR